MVLCVWKVVMMPKKIKGLLEKNICRMSEAGAEGCGIGRSTDTQILNRHTKLLCMVGSTVQPTPPWAWGVIGFSRVPDWFSPNWGKKSPR